MKKLDTISIVIPCYGSEKTIENVVGDTIKTLSKRKNKYEIILVNDCSPDSVWNKIRKLHKLYPRIVKGINFTKNYGQQAALMAGYRESKGDIIVSFDDDGQTDPKDLWKLVDKLNEGYDVVFGNYSSLKENIFRRFGSKINDIMSETLLGKPKNVYCTSYIAFKKYIIDSMVEYNKSFPYISGLIYRATKNIGQVQIEHHNRIEGKSGYTLKKLVELLINGFTAFSIEPLRFATYLGFVVAFIGFIYGIVVIINKIINPSLLQGYSSIMAVLLFVSGVVMILLGLIGEYIGRIYISINNSPQYVIKEKI